MIYILKNIRYIIKELIFYPKGDAKQPTANYILALKEILLKADTLWYNG